jgi:hypothetical protein
MRDLIHRICGAIPLLAISAGACASAHKPAPPNPALLAAIPADLRMVGAESTWVARGVGYELVTRSQLEIPPLISQLDDQSRFFNKLFATDPAKIIAAVRRLGPPGSIPEASAPVPLDLGPVVEIVTARPLTSQEVAAQEKQRASQPTDGPERFGASGPTARVVRAWLSARASALTGKPAASSAASATVDDPRVPAWAEDALPGLAVPTVHEDTLAARLAMQIDSLFPIHTLLTMPRPSYVTLAGRGGTRGGVASGGTGGYGGGMGGRRGGMGGYGGGMGRGAPRGGSGAYDGGRPNPPLLGGALFAAEALMFGRYLVVREGPSFVGALVDAQVQRKPVGDVFSTAQIVPADVERLDIEFHRWLMDRTARER